MSDRLADLPAAPSTALICHPSDPALEPDQAADLQSAVAKLFTQFEREGSVGSWAVEVAHGGHFLLIAWTSGASGEPLSGCRKDKLAKVVALHHERTGCNLLTPPPIWIAAEAADQPTPCTPRRFRDLVAEGRVDETTLAWDTTATDLATWQALGARPIAEIPWLTTQLRRVRDRLSRA